MEKLIQHTQNAIEDSYNNNSKLTQEILSIEGMSGNKTRHLYNNICSLENSTYLEVGTWKGSSFVSALYGNDKTYGFCVDNWSEFGGPRESFYKNRNKFLDEKNTRVLDMNCWDVTGEVLNGRTIDIFLYDGAHNYEDQKKAITYYHKYFSENVIIMVDDWTCDWVRVREGTMDGLKEANLEIVYSEEIGLVNTTTHHTGGDTFWNGCGVFVCRRQN